LNIAAGFDTRKLAVMLAGACAFLQLYVTQPLLPMLTDVFHASKIAVSLTVTAASLGVAAAAPFAGHLADRMGRKPVIVWSAFLLAAASFATATAPNLNILILWRFLQGLCTPGVFAVTIAYINDEWAGLGAPRVVAIYVTGTVLGGFSGRMLSGLIAAYAPWPWTFAVLASLSLLGACGVAVWLPDEKRFRRGGRAEQTAQHAGDLSGWPAARAHFLNKPLLATFFVGFCVLFSLVATFTYVTFYLAEPPFGLRPAALGLVFVVYLIGAAVTPITGRAIDRHGNRVVLAAAIAGHRRRLHHPGPQSLGRRPRFGDHVLRSFHRASRSQQLHRHSSQTKPCPGCRDVSEILPHRRQRRRRRTRLRMGSGRLARLRSLYRRGANAHRDGRPPLLERPQNRTSS